MRKATLFFFLICFAALSLKAQQNTSSPYSRFAFGEINPNPLAHYGSLGGASIAISDSLLLNLSNPASFANIVPHRPIFDIGLGGQRLTISSGDLSEENGSFGLRNITLGIPISRKAGFSFGILPFSSVGYNMQTTIEEENIGPVKYIYTGNGGINRLFLGAGFKLIQNEKHELSIGLRSSYLFGNLQRIRKAIYPAFIGVRHTKIRHSTIVSDFLFDGGIQYSLKVKENKSYTEPNGKFIPGSTHFLRFGITYTAASEINARQEMFAHTFFDQTFEAVVDTVKYQDTIRGYMSFPQKIGIGAVYDFKIESSSGMIRRFLISGQFEQQTWSEYSEVFGSSSVTDQLSDSRIISAGFQFTPDISRRSSAKPRIWETSHYRMGIRYSDTYLQLNNTQLTQYGISFGLGLPLYNASQSFSMINIGCELGKRGTTENQLLQENYLNFFIGFSIMPWAADGWFYRRKYD